MSLNEHFTCEEEGAEVVADLDTWLRALESDEYKQARKSLAAFDGFEGDFRDAQEGDISGMCCLGVCALVVDKAPAPTLARAMPANRGHRKTMRIGLVLRPEEEGFTVRAESARKALPDRAFDYAHHLTLMELNDRFGLTFKEIARVVRAELDAGGIPAPGGGGWLDEVEVVS